MRHIPSLLSEHLGGGATTLARCWKVLRRDGVSLGFTDHDNLLSFGGVEFIPVSGLDSSQAESVL